MIYKVASISKKMKRKIYALFAALFAILLLTSLASAKYITGEIFIDELGQARFELETDISINLEGLVFQDNKVTGETNLLTSKTGDTWTFALDLDEYDDILLDIHLPKGLTAITALSGVDNSINIENGIITLIDSGKLTFEVSYKIERTQDRSFLLWILLILLIIIAFVIYSKLKKKKERFKNILPLINENEHKIIDLLMKAPMRQKEIRKILNIPKASFSRYITNLEKKKLILREGEGKNKIVKLK